MATFDQAPGPQDRGVVGRPADICYADLFAEGCTSEEAADEAIENSMS